MWNRSSHLLRSGFSGVLLSIVVKPGADRPGCLLVLDAAKLTELARAEVNAIIPVTLHGMYKPWFLWFLSATRMRPETHPASTLDVRFRNELHIFFSAALLINLFTASFSSADAWNIMKLLLCYYCNKQLYTVSGEQQHTLIKTITFTAWKIFSFNIKTVSVYFWHHYFILNNFHKNKNKTSMIVLQFLILIKPLAHEHPIVGCSCLTRFFLTSAFLFDTRFDKNWFWSFNGSATVVVVSPNTWENLKVRSDFSFNYLVSKLVVSISTLRFFVGPLKTLIAQPLNTMKWSSHSIVIKLHGNFGNKWIKWLLSWFLTITNLSD